MENWDKIKKNVMDKCKTDLSKHRENLTKDNQDYFLKGQSMCSDYESTGLYFKEYDLLWDKLVPDSGESKTIIGEMIRILGRLNHEYFNNGNCNLQDVITEDCDDCDGSGYEECKSFGCEEGYVYVDDDDGNEVKELCPDCDGDYKTYANCGYCGGDIYIYTGKYEITEYYDEMLRFIDGYISDIVETSSDNFRNYYDELVDMLENHYCYEFNINATYKDKPIERYYNTFTDELMYIILQSKTNPVNKLYEVAEV